jgi:hypothetical protein
MAKTGSDKNMKSGIQGESDRIKFPDLKGVITPLTFLKIAQGFRPFDS